MKKSVLIVLAAVFAVSTSVPVRAQSPAANTPAGTARYNQSGDRMIDFFDIHGAEVRSVLRQLSAYSGMDMVSSDAVRASVTLSVTNKSWREILGIVCMVHNLTYVEERGFIYVMTNAEAVTRGVGIAGRDGAGVAAGVAAGTAGALKPADEAEMLAPLVREVIPMRYVTAQELTTAITPFLSPRGKLTSISHTNSIVLVDTEENLSQLKHLIGQIDVQTPQVSISCKIIEVSSGAMQQMGVNWGFMDQGNNVTAGQFWGGEETVLFSSMTHNVTYGVLSPEKFQVAMNYLFEDNKAEIVAQPQITTLNNKEATVFIGSQIPITTKDEASNTITEMVTAGTQLTVTPFVSGDGKIMLSLSPSRESYAFTSAGNPIINQQSATTNVLVNNGETVVIAGLTSNEKIESESGIPFLKNIPIIGTLFKRSTKSNNKLDVVIFVTPHIIHPEI